MNCTDEHLTIISRKGWIFSLLKTALSEGLVFQRYELTLWVRKNCPVTVLYPFVPSLSSPFVPSLSFVSLKPPALQKFLGRNLTMKTGLPPEWNKARDDLARRRDAFV